MITRSKIVSVWYGIIYVSVIISVLGRLTLLFVGCTEKKVAIPVEFQSGQKITVHFSLEDVTCDSNEVAAYSFNDIIPETVTALGSDDLLMSATFEVDRHCTKHTTTTCWAENAEVRIVAYLGETTYHSHADYTVVGGVLISDEPLQIYAGSYKFVAYLHDCSCTMPSNHDCSTSTLDTSIYLMCGYYPENGTYLITETFSESIPIMIL